MKNIISEDFSAGAVVAPSKKLEDLIHLAELCVDLLQQNEEHYAEVSVSKRIFVTNSKLALKFCFSQN